MSIVNLNRRRTRNHLDYGEKGELVIIGDSVSIGYLNNPEMTNKAFFQTTDNRQGYRTAI